LCDKQVNGHSVGGGHPVYSTLRKREKLQAPRQISQPPFGLM